MSWSETFASVFDLEGTVLLEEKQVASNRKFEGVCPKPVPGPSPHGVVEADAAGE